MKNTIGKDKTDEKKCSGISCPRIQGRKLLSVQAWLSRKGSSVIFSLVFVFPVIINLLFFYLGLAFEDNLIREHGFIILNSIFAVLCGMVFLSLRAERKSKHVKLTVTALGLLFVAACYVFSYLKSGTTNVLVKFLPQFVVFCVPSYFSGYSGALMHKEDLFFSPLENVSLIAAPAAVYYLALTIAERLPEKWAGGLGVMNYMNVAYAFMPFLLAHMIRFVENGKWAFPFSCKEIKRPQWIRAALSMLYWFAIIGTGTRGTYVCIVVVCLLLLVRRKKKKRRWRRLTLPIGLIVILLGVLFVYTPPGFSRVHRMDSFLKGVAEGTIDTSIEHNLSDDLIEQSVDGTMQIDALQTEGYGFRNRGTLYKLAWKEFLKSPLTGMGPLGYMIKYGLYPHNAVLELLCETGAFGICFLILLAAVLLRLLMLSKTDESVWPVVLFLSAYIIYANISGCIWICSALQWGLGYGLTVCSISGPDVHLRKRVSSFPSDSAIGDYATKVCHMTSAHGAEDGRIFQKECTSLVKAGYDVYLVERGDSYDKNGVHIVGVGNIPNSRMKRMTIGARKVYQAARILNADIYHLHDPELLPYGMKLKRAGKKVIFDSHERYTEQIRTKPYLPAWAARLAAAVYGMYEEHVLSRIDGLVFPCTVNGVIPLGFKCRHKVTANNVPLFSEIEEFSYENREKDKRSVCYVGGLAEARGVLQMMRAAAIADVTLHLAGPYESPAFKAQVEAMPEYSHVAYEGILNRTQVIQLLSRCNIGMSVLRNIGQYNKGDNFPTKVYEYMAAGLPAVLTDAPYVSGFMKKTPFGICVDPENAEEIAEAITYLLDHPDVAESMGKAGQKAAREQLNWSIEEQKLFSFYKEVINGGTDE